MTASSRSRAWSAAAPSGWYQVPGVYHVVDDDPSPVSRWLPAFARWVGAPPPPRVTEREALDRRGEDAVYYGTRLRGASNAKAKTALNFAPRPREWLDS